MPVAVVETSLFLRLAAGLWTEQERQGFVDYIARNPELGDVIPDTGGVRVIYFYHNPMHPIFLLMVYAKAAREDVAPEEKKALADFAARIKRTARP